MRFIHLYAPNGLAISIRLDLITTVEEMEGGGALIRLDGGQWREVGSKYRDVIRALEKEEPIEEENQSDHGPDS